MVCILVQSNGVPRCVRQPDVCYWCMLTRILVAVHIVQVARLLAQNDAVQPLVHKAIVVLDKLPYQLGRHDDHGPQECTCKREPQLAAEYYRVKETKRLQQVPLVFFMHSQKGSLGRGIHHCCDGTLTLTQPSCSAAAWQTKAPLLHTTTPLP